MFQNLRSLYSMLVVGMTTLIGCTSSIDADEHRNSVFSGADLLDRTFQIEDVSGRGIIDSSHITLIFGPDGHFSGSAGCNTIFGTYQRSNDHLEFGPLAATRKMCAPALMNQEQAVLEVLSDVTRIEQDKEGALIVWTTDGRSLRGFESTQSKIQTYLCDDGVTVKATYPTQDTAKIIYKSQTFDMTIVPSASSARYIGAGWQWWSKGGVEAYLAPLAVGETIASDKGISCRKR